MVLWGVLGAAAPAIAVMIGGTMVAVAGPACAQVTSLLYSLQRTYQDPPVTDYTTVATVIRQKPAKVSFASCAGLGDVDPTGGGVRRRDRDDGPPGVGSPRRR